MSCVNLTNDAEQDLDDIYDYIAEESQSPGTAARFLRRINAKCELYAQEPLLGESRPDIGERIRIFPHQSYVVLYRPVDDGIEVIRVLHGARHFDSLF